MTGFEPAASCSQSRRATNCATPGYEVVGWPGRILPKLARYQLRYTRIFSFLHDTTQEKKKQVFRVCGRRCGQARFCGGSSGGGFPPQATVPRTSGLSLSGEWIGSLSSQSRRATNCATPGYPVFLHDTTREKKKQVFRVCGRQMETIPVCAGLV